MIKTPPNAQKPSGQSYFYFLQLMRKDMIGFVENLAGQGDFLRIPLGPFSVYFINHPEIIREVMVTQADKFNKPASIKSAAKSLFGENLFTSDGELWRSLRKIVAPAFQGSQLRHYTHTMFADTQHMLNHWHDGNIIDIPQQMAS